jgi:hypothetical protein
MTPDMQHVSSSVIEAVGYDAASKELHVRFTNGRTYVYFDMEPFQFEQLLSADSKGSYFNREIRPRYRYEER